MSTLTPHDDELAKTLQRLCKEVQALSHKVDVLTKKLKVPEEEDKEYSPLVRFSMTLAAQIGGFFLLWLLGSNTFELDKALEHQSIRDGLEYILTVERIYMAGSGIILISVLVMLWYFDRDFNRHFNVDIVLLGFVAFDLSLLLFLVCQEGGLCRSMFLPVFFLIPAAYNIAERHSKRYHKRKLFVFSCILVCIYISYRYAAWAQPPESMTPLQPAVGTFYVLWWWLPVDVTDFSTLAHRDYDEAVWYASCISALVPIIQILAPAFIDKLKKVKNMNRDVASPEAQQADNTATSGPE